MPEVAFAIPGDLATPTGGYAYDREILARLPGFGISAHHLELPSNYPDPTAPDLEETSRLCRSLPGKTILLIDGLAFGAMPADLVAELRQPVIALVHHPLGYEPGIAAERARELITSERQALSFARRVIATSPFTRRLLVQEFGVPEDSISVAIPGTEPAPRAHGTGAPLELLSIGSITPRKAFPILVEALAPLADLDWRLTIAGPLDRDQNAVTELRETIARHRLEHRIALAGALDQKQIGKAYAAADVFVLPSLFEGFGMVLTEAMARGLPVICTTGGAAAETLPDDASIKVPPGQVVPLSDALRQLIVDPELRRQLSDAAWDAAQDLPRWDQAAQRVAEVIREVAR